jgi:serine/threonine protein kinase
MSTLAASHFGPYRLIHALGAGGMGEVFLARHEGEGGIQRLVALKRVLPHLNRDPKRAQLFLDEVRIAAQLVHSNVVQVVDHGRIAQQYFMAMEYVHGENLNEVFERLRSRNQRLPVEMLLHIVAAACEGLDYAHRKRGVTGESLGIVHRDISPHNILLSFEGGVKIADFGVARAADKTQKTLTGELRGKICYMSPEQAYGRVLDQRSDLFSLGIVIYEGLTGDNPFLRAEPLASLELVRAAHYAPIAELHPDVPPEVEELVARCLQQNPADRPDSARALHDELLRVIRLHNLALTAFDLADYLKDLFPESRSPESSAPQVSEPEAATAEAATAVGRRADGLDAAAAREARTIAYLRQRHPSGNVAPSATSPEDSRSAPAATRWVGWIVALVFLGAIVTTAAVHFGGEPAALSGSEPAVLSGAQKAEPSGSETDSVAPGVSAGDAQRDVGLEQDATPSAQTDRLARERALGAADGGPSADAIGVRLSVRKRPQRANLRVQSSHPCTVELDRQRLGPTPLERKVAPGRHELRCIDLGSGIRARRRVTVRPGRTTRVQFRFGTLAINVEPWARVSVDGKAKGTTPVRLVLPPGEHRLELRNTDAGLARTRSVYVSAGQTLRISSW